MNGGDLVGRLVGGTDGPQSDGLHAGPQGPWENSLDTLSHASNSLIPCVSRSQLIRAPHEYVPPASVARLSQTCCVQESQLQCTEDVGLGDGCEVGSGVGGSVGSCEGVKVGVKDGDELGNAEGNSLYIGWSESFGS